MGSNIVRTNTHYISVHIHTSSMYNREKYSVICKGIDRGGSKGSDKPPFQRQNFIKLKITPNLTALELFAHWRSSVLLLRVTSY